MATKLLNTKDGETFLQWLRDEIRFDRSIYETHDGKVDYSETPAKLREGMRQMFIEITNTRDNEQ